MSNATHYKATGNESTRTWNAPGGVKVVAVRDAEFRWSVEQGPANLVGKSFRHMRDLRIAVKQS